jgi:hypothetical protein
MIIYSHIDLNCDDLVAVAVVVAAAAAADATVVAVVDTGIDDLAENEHAD